MKGGKISITVLDSVDSNAVAEEIDEATIRKTPGWSISGDHILNKIIVSWAWSEGLQKYTRTSEFTDADSIALYGEKSPYELKIKGPQVADSGGAIVTDRASRLLNRFATPRAEVNLISHFSRFFIELGDDVLVSHRFLPQEGGTLGFSGLMETLSKSVGALEQDANIRWKLAFTSYSGIRIGKISPSPTFTIGDQSTITVPATIGLCYKIGYRVRLWDALTNSYEADPVNEITGISGDTLTFGTPWVTTLGAEHLLFFADYDQVNEDQKARFAFVSPDSNVFLSDSSKAYEIVL
jgi:hypothetical protein